MLCSSERSRRSTALCIYDYLLTLHRETGCIWKERFSVASTLFLLNRYVTLCNCVVNMVELVPWVARNPLSADHVSHFNFLPFAAVLTNGIM